jgi:hypothetical protein
MSLCGPTRTSRVVCFIAAIGGIADLKGGPDTPGLPLKIRENRICNSEWEFSRATPTLHRLSSYGP